MSAYPKLKAGSAVMPRYRQKDARYEKPPAPLSTDAAHHTGRQWHVCVTCRESWLCGAQDDRHGHPGCPGAPYVFRAWRKPLPADWPREVDEPDDDDDDDDEPPEDEERDGQIDPDPFA